MKKIEYSKLLNIKYRNKKNYIRTGAKLKVYLDYLTAMHHNENSFEDLVAMNKGYVPSLRTDRFDGESRWRHKERQELIKYYNKWVDLYGERSSVDNRKRYIQTF
tara:strand:- start:108 stop:422 length:315 start_codon:yes stop_codon:yes gene_type:complete